MPRYRRCKVMSAFVLLLLCAAAPSRAAMPPPLPPPAGIEEARQRIERIRAQRGEIESWVDNNWEPDFDRSNQGLSRSPQQGSKETGEEFKARQMKVRMAVSDVKARLRIERKSWLDREWERVLAAEIVEDLPVKLGPYDQDRKQYPLLFGFGWPSGLSVKLRVPENRHKAFEIKFPPKVPATFRVNPQGEVLLLSIEKRWDADSMDVYVPPPGPRLSWQAEHASWVTAVAFRPDGSHVASAGAEGVLACWDADSGNPVFRLEKAEMAMSLAFSPDGAAIATGGSDAILRLRNAATGKEIWRGEVEGKNKGMIMAVAFSPDGRHVVTGDDAGFLRVWNAVTGEEKLKVEAGTPIRAIDFTKGGKRVVVGGEGSRVLLWDFGADKFVWNRKTEWPVYAVSANPSGGGIAIGGGGSELIVLSEADGTESWSARTEGEVRSLRYDPTGRLLASGGAGYTAKVFHATGGAAVWSAEIGNPIRSLAFGADGRKLFVGSADKSLRMFDIDEQGRVQAAFGAPGRIYIERSRVDKLFR